MIEQFKNDYKELKLYSSKINSEPYGIFSLCIYYKNFSDYILELNESQILSNDKFFKLKSLVKNSNVENYFEKIYKMCKPFLNLKIFNSKTINPKKLGNQVKTLIFYRTIYKDDGNISKFDPMIVELVDTILSNTDTIEKINGSENQKISNFFNFIFDQINGILTEVKTINPHI